MRTLLPLSLLLATLPAQDPAARPSPTIPPAPEPALEQVEQVAQNLRQLGHRGQQAVLFDEDAGDGNLWALGTAWKAAFDARGATVIPFFGSHAPQNFPLRLELASAIVGGEALQLGQQQPTHSASQIRTDRGSLVEVFDTRLDSLEQSFVFDRLPNRGDVTVEVRIASELVASQVAGGLRFANEHGHVDYTKAVAVDANGARLDLPIEWTGTAARMVIPSSFVQQAALPLVLDPLLNYWFLLGSAAPAGQLQRDSDVASFQGNGGRTLLVWKRQWSVTDQDCWGLMFDGSLGLVQTDFNIDFTARDWLKVACASSDFAQNFLLVSEIREGTLHWIGGHTITANATVSSLITIERDGVVGTPGNNYHPDVGGDPFPGPGNYCVVFQKVNGVDADPYARIVTPAGTLATTTALQLSSLVQTESRPAIAKSCGTFGGATSQWLITWQRTWPTPPFDQEIWGTYMNWSGVLNTAAFEIANTIAEETAPSPGAPIDIAGERLWPLAYELASILGQPRDIQLRLLRGDGTTRASTTVSSSAAGFDDREPECDADGQRIVVGFTGQGTAGNPAETVALLAFVGATSTFRVDSYGLLTAMTGETNTQVNVCADFSGGYATSPRYFVSYSQENTNTLNLVNYGGWLPGSFFTTFGSQCGTLSITPSGSPVIGQSVTMTAGNGAASLVALGFPGLIPLTPLGCNCVLGVSQAILFGNPLVWNVPNDAAFVGITLSAQGLTVIGNQCLGFLDLSDTIDFTIR